MGGYGFSVEVAGEVDEVEERVRGLLKEQGFGVLTEIDVRQTLREKLGADFRPYRILGACNPPLAHRALQAEPEIGLLLPCNVVVEQSAPGRTGVHFMDPEAALGLVDNAAVAEIAVEARERLRRVASSLEGG